MDTKDNLEQQQMQQQNTEDRLAIEAVELMCQFGINRFKDIDTNNDSYLSRRELEDAAQGNRFALPERKQLKVLADHVDDLQKVIHHTWGWKEDTKGIHNKDLVLTKQNAQFAMVRLEEARAYRDVFKRNWSSLDRNSDSLITFDELKDGASSLSIERSDRLNLREALSYWYGRKDPQHGDSNIRPDLFNRMVAEAEDRRSTDKNQRLVWSLADSLRKQ